MNFHLTCLQFPKHDIRRKMCSSYFDGRHSLWWPIVSCFHSQEMICSQKCDVTWGANIFLDCPKWEHFELTLSDRRYSRKIQCDVFNGHLRIQRRRVSGGHRNDTRSDQKFATSRDRKRVKSCECVFPEAYVKSICGPISSMWLPLTWPSMLSNQPKERIRSVWVGSGRYDLPSRFVLPNLFSDDEAVHFVFLSSYISHC